MKNLELASPSEMSASARAGEIAAILAAAIVRTLVADEPKQREVGLGFLPDQRVHTTPYQQDAVVMNDQHTSVAAQVATLPSLPMTEVWALWDRFFPRRPDKINRVYLESRIAYKLQEEAFGGLDPDTRRRLVNIGVRHSKIKQPRKARDITLAPGTVLVREWGDRDHHVRVTADGTFEYEGQQFKSLSAVARHIAGSPWSGPLFFGLRRAGEGYE